MRVHDKTISDGYLTIIPRVRMGYESIAHEAEARMGYEPIAHEAEGRMGY